MELSSVHPFPARMAPELARSALEAVPRGGRVLDPMCGSGTVLRAAVEAGFHCVGIDMDPLSVIMSRAWTVPQDPGAIRDDAATMVDRAEGLPACAIRRSRDPETRRFISYWFGSKQEDALARLATVLAQHDRPTEAALRVALSRIIVSKEMMASLARDTSHSRPHRVADENDFDVNAGFLRSAGMVSRRLLPERIRARSDVHLGDARKLEGIDDDRFDVIITSPPYLNAIDYLRGHRLALVWMGYEMASLRATRAASVGAERILPRCPSAPSISPHLTQAAGSRLKDRQKGWIRRYAVDMKAVLEEAYRTVKLSGRVVMVLGNSFIRGTKVDNAGLVEALAIGSGFRVVDRSTRDIPARRRYLPPPGDGKNALDTRMRTETVLTLMPTRARGGSQPSGGVHCG